MGEGAAVGEFQFSAHGYAMGDAGGANLVTGGEIADEMSGRLTFDGGIGGEDDFLYLATGESFGQLIDAQLFRTYAIQRGQAAVQHEVLTIEMRGLIDDPNIGGAFDDA